MIETEMIHHLFFFLHSSPSVSQNGRHDYMIDTKIEGKRNKPPVKTCEL